MSLDEAIEGAAVAIEGRVAGGSEIAVYKITAPRDEIGDYLAEDLNDKISMRGNLVPLARGAALQSVDTEQQLQMSGLVSDASAVGVGHYLGAKVVVTGTFNRYADFSQLRLRAIDVQTSALRYSYTARINNRDRVLANITAPLGTIQAPRVTENALAHLNRGKDLLAEKKYDDSILEFNKALAINKNLAEAYNLRGNAYFSKGNIAVNGKSDFERAIADFTVSLRLDGNDNSLMMRGFAYVLNGDTDLAIADVNSMLRNNPNEGIKFFALQLRGRAYLSKGDYDRAIADFTATLSIDQNEDFFNAGSHYFRGLAYLAKEDFDRAITDFNDVLHIGSTLASESLLHRGKAYFLKGDDDRAITDFTAFLQINPSDTLALYSRASAYREKGDLDRAIADYTQAISLGPNFAFYYYRGNAYFEKGDLDRAIADYTQAIRLDSNNVGAYHNRGLAYAYKGDYDRAIADYTQAIRLDSNNVGAYANRGLAYAGKGDLDRAITDWEAVLRIEPNNADVRQNLERARQMRGR